MSKIKLVKKGIWHKSTKLWIILEVNQYILTYDHLLYVEHNKKDESKKF